MFESSLITRSRSTFSATENFLNDVLLTFGTGGDVVMLNRSTTNVANTVIAGVLIGTPVTPALAADTYILSNVTASGDILIAANLGGNSLGWIFVDSSASLMYLGSTTPASVSSAGLITVANATDSTSGSTGAISTLGGLGVTKALFVGTTIWLNDTSNAKMTTGITINQGAADNEIVTLKSSDVAHGITDLSETDTFGAIDKGVAAGGIRIRGYVATGSSVGATINGFTADAANTTTSTAGAGMTQIGNAIKNGTSITTVADAGNIFAVDNSGATKLILKGNGDLHIDGSGGVNTIGAYDDHIDFQIARDIKASLVSEGHEWRIGMSKMMEKHKELFASRGMVTYNDDGHHFVNLFAFDLFALDAIYQMGTWLTAVGKVLTPDQQKQLPPLMQTALAETN